MSGPYTMRDIAKYNPQTDTTTVVNHLVYDAFGKVTSETNPAVDSLFLFTARPFDAETKHRENLAPGAFGQQLTPNNLNRWYDARVGRWPSEDPIGFDAGDGNLYRYVGDGVILSVNQDGLDIERLQRVNGYHVKYQVAKQNDVKAFPGTIVDPVYPGPWGQPADRASGWYQVDWGAETRVKLIGANVCNTIPPGVMGENMRAQCTLRSNSQVVATRSYGSGRSR